MRLDITIGKNLLTPIVAILADKLYFPQLLLNVFLDADEAWLFAHKGAMAGLFSEFVQA